MYFYIIWHYSKYCKGSILKSICEWMRCVNFYHTTIYVATFRNVCACVSESTCLCQLVSASDYFEHLESHILKTKTAKGLLRVDVYRVKFGKIRHVLPVESLVLQHILAFVFKLTKKTVFIF